MKRILFTFSLVIFSFFPILSQEKPPKVLKYNSVKYPPAALATLTSGSVPIAVEIDENGRVISANNLGGHPLLTTSALEAARQWIFSKSISVPRRSLQVEFVYRIDLRKSSPPSVTKTVLRRPYRLEIKIIYYPVIDYGRSY